MTLAIERVRDRFERMYRARQKRLLKRFGAGVKAAVREQHAQARAQRDRFLATEALSRILAALPSTPAAIRVVVQIVGLLSWIENERVSISGSDPAVALSGRELRVTGPERSELERRRDELLDRLPTLGAAQVMELDALDLQLKETTVHRWVRKFAAQAGRGRGRQRESGWRGLFVAELDQLMPNDVERRNGAIAELLRIAAADRVITHRHVHAILRDRATRKD